MNHPLSVDEQGLHVPKDGTDSSAVYRMMRQGVGCSEIARRLGKPRNTVGVLMHRIRHGRPSRSRVNHVLRQQSLYVRKLVNILGMSLAEAVETERALAMQEQHAAPLTLVK
jgi:hypothetical protein